MDRLHGEADGIGGTMAAGRASGHVTAAPTRPPAHPAVPTPVAPVGPRASQALALDTRRSLLVAGVGVAAGAALLAGPAGLGGDVLLRALALYGLGAALVWRALHPASGPAPHPFDRFGAANRVTLLRMAVLALLGALVGEPALGAAGPDAAAWGLIVVATASALLDAVDGALARRSGLASAFGARFDMETDAAFTLVLAALVQHAGQAGAWVLAMGLMRYAFVAAAAAWPWLAAPLAPSRRRQTVCVVTITVLIVALGPIVPAPLAAALAATALALLSLSFAVDVRALARARRRPPETRP